MSAAQKYLPRAPLPGTRRSLVSGRESFQNHFWVGFVPDPGTNQTQKQRAELPCWSVCGAVAGGVLRSLIAPPRRSGLQVEAIDVGLAGLEADALVQAVGGFT